MPVRSRASRWLLWSPFATIVIIFALVTGLDVYMEHAVQRRGRTIAAEALASMDLVGRLASAIDEKRIAVFEHILELSPARMDELRQRIDRCDAAFSEAARQYEPLTTNPSEASVWAGVKGLFPELRAPLQRVLQLSREGRQQEAWRQAREVERHFGSIHREMERLVRINRDAASAALERIGAMHQSKTILSIALAGAGIALVVVLAVMMSRLVRRRERQTHELVHVLEEQNRDLEAFAGRVAHDLRGPLTTISLAVSRLPEEERVRPALQRGVARMAALIQDLLTLSGIQGTEADQVVDPAAIAASVGEEMGPRFEAEGAVLRLEVEPAKVQCSEGLLRQVIWNLVENALKYRRPGVAARVELAGHAATPATYELRVTDNGIGMSPEEARHAFEPFYRAKRLPEARGTGLGLSIVKRVIDVCGGSISIDSRVGEGTTFIVHFRCAPAA